jgi:prepilin-type N-terminal cleavage/methylation domain-containing protein
MRNNLKSQLRGGHETGFTLIETMVTLAVLVTVLGIVFTYIGRLQRVYKTEETKVDATQETRTVLDSMERELHQAGFPGHNMYGPNVLNVPIVNDVRNAVGLVKISPSDLWFEGDTDNDGRVESIRYTLMDAAGAAVTAASTCPCTLRRSQVLKANAAPTAQATNYVVALDNVINSGGVGAGGAALALTGNTTFSTGTSVANDVLYAAYKTPAIFTAYDQNGAVVAATDITTNPSAIATVRTITISLNLLTIFNDAQTKMRPPVGMRTTVKLSNY